jgi:hypothetical protein
MFMMPFYPILYNPDYQNKFGFILLDANTDSDVLKKEEVANAIRSLEKKGKSLNLMAESILTLMVLNLGFMPEKMQDLVVEQ